MTSCMSTPALPVGVPALRHWDAAPGVPKIPGIVIRLIVFNSNVPKNLPCRNDISGLPCKVSEAIGSIPCHNGRQYVPTPALPLSHSSGSVSACRLLWTP